MYSALWVHKSVGLSILTVIALQIALGFWHHRIFLKTGARTVMSRYHRVLGFVLAAGGTANALLCVIPSYIKLRIVLQTNSDYSALSASFAAFTLIAALGGLWIVLIILLKYKDYRKQVVGKSGVEEGSNLEIEVFL